jgi:hypothetical protein
MPAAARSARLFSGEVPKKFPLWPNTALDMVPASAASSPGMQWLYVLSVIDTLACPIATETAY